MTAPQALLQARNAFLQGRTEQAISLVQRYLQRDPGHPEANHSMAVMLVQSGQHQRALYFAQRAVDASPKTADYRLSLAATLDHAGQRERAIDEAAKAGELGGARALLELLPLYWGMGEFELALNAGREAMKTEPRAARAPLAQVLQHVGNLDEAISLLRAELDRDPNAQDLLMALCQALNYAPGVDPREVFAVHQRLGPTFAPYTRPNRASRASKDPDRRLRVGFISPDLYSQSVSFFAEPLIQHLSRRDFEVFCYSTHPYPDATTQRLKGLADGWRDLAGADGPTILARLDADNLDILIELAGITTGHVLHIMAARPAPVQVTAIGYPNTTGLPQIDYRLVDAITDPPETWGNSLATERLARVPGCFLCYRPIDAAPDPTHNSHEGVTFGSFNVIQKVVPPVMDAWVRIVTSVPGSRLVLKASQLSTPSIRERIAARFQAAGLDPSRLELRPPVKSKTDHLAVYNLIDIALDPFPYNGTTTTCEALLMGVPVVSLEGEAHASRVGSSLLRAAGLPELVAPTIDDYISIATMLATDEPRRREYRATLRPRLLASPLCDGPAYGTRVGAALREMWRDHCLK